MRCESAKSFTDMEPFVRMLCLTVRVFKESLSSTLFMPAALLRAEMLEVAGEMGTGLACRVDKLRICKNFESWRSS